MSRGSGGAGGVGGTGGGAGGVGGTNGTNDTDGTNGTDDTGGQGSPAFRAVGRAINDLEAAIGELLIAVMQSSTELELQQRVNQVKLALAALMQAYTTFQKEGDAADKQWVADITNACAKMVAGIVNLTGGLLSMRGRMKETPWSEAYTKAIGEVAMGIASMLEGAANIAATFDTKEAAKLRAEAALLRSWAEQANNWSGSAGSLAQSLLSTIQEVLRTLSQINSDYHDSMMH